MPHEIDELVPGRTQIVIYPARSSSRVGRYAMVGGVGVVSGALATAFAAAGAWPVAAFMAIPPVGMYFGMKASQKSGGAYQVITLEDYKVRIEDFSPFRKRADITLSSVWLRASAQGPDDAKERLILTQRGKAIEIGSFLPPDEKAEMAIVLNRFIAHHNASTVVQSKNQKPAP